jgi:hypothetical protein
MGASTADGKSRRLRGAQGCRDRRAVPPRGSANLYTVNSVTGKRENGAITVRFVDRIGGEIPANAIPNPEGWNYLIRPYRPRAEILDGRWTPPTRTPTSGG